MSFTSDPWGCVEPGYEPCDTWGMSWNLYESRKETQITWIEDPPTPEEPSGGGGGGEPEPQPTYEQTVIDELIANETALLGPCPELIRDWQWQISFEPRQPIKDKLQQLSNAGFHFNSKVPTQHDYHVQSIQNAVGPIINLDRYSVFLSDLPTINNHRLSLTEFMDYVRLHLTKLSGTSFTPSTGVPAPANEAWLWQNAPFGAVIDIGVPPDGGSVIVSEYAPGHGSAGWAFTTIRDPLNHAHPVSGTRWFGVYEAQNGYIFYTQGVDRLTGYLDTTFGAISDIKGGEGKFAFQFEEGDKLWQRLIGNVKGLFDGGSIFGNQGISAEVKPPEANRTNFDKLQEALQNGRPLSTLDCN